MDYAKEYDRMVEQSNKQQIEIENLRKALEETNRTLTVENALNPTYGWDGWLNEYVRPLLTHNEQK